MRLGTSRSFLYPRLWTAARKAVVGEITGPVPVKDGYSVFRVRDRSGGEVMSLEKAKAKARVLLQSQKRDSLFQDLVTRLRAEYAARITIDPRESRAALPDSLLERLYREREVAIAEQSAKL